MWGAGLTVWFIDVWMVMSATWVELKGSDKTLLLRESLYLGRCWAVQRRTSRRRAGGNLWERLILGRKFRPRRSRHR